MSASEQSRPVISDGLPSQLPDIDPAQTREWVDSLRRVVEAQGPYRARYLMLRMLQESPRYHLDDPGFYPTGVSAGGDA